jgi:hypothetical protein
MRPSVDLRVWFIHESDDAEITPCSDVGRMWLQFGPFQSCKRLGDAVFVEHQNACVLVKDAEAYGLSVEVLME